MFRTKKSLIIIVFIFLCATLIIYKNTCAKSQFAKIDILNNGRIVAEFYAEIANKPEEQLRGLMYRDSLPKNHGMLFIFEQSKIISMWMKNTKIPLDMIFINEKHEIVHIHKNAIPYSTDEIFSEQPATEVLEINAGEVDESKIKTGYKVMYKLK